MGDNMQTIKAMYDGAGFTAMQPIPIQGKCEVIIIFPEQSETITQFFEVVEEPDYIERLCGSLAAYPEMAVDKFLERTRADKELEL